MQHKNYKYHAQILKVLANETRLKILEYLNNKDYSVGELCKLLKICQPTLSKHLSYLKTHGIISDYRVGNFVFYKLQISCVMNFFTLCNQSVRT